MPKSRPRSEDRLPAIDHTYEADFGDVAFRLRFTADGRLTYAATAGPRRGVSETVAAEVTAIRPGIYLVTWRETNGTAVVHAQDYERSVVYASVSLPGSAFSTMRGRLARVT